MTSDQKCHWRAGWVTHEFVHFIANEHTMATLATAGLAGRDLSIVDLDEVHILWGENLIADAVAVLVRSSVLLGKHEVQAHARHLCRIPTANLTACPCKFQG